MGIGQKRFNPHPARRPGATLAGCRAGSPCPSCFNPHPARRPGATSHSGTTDPLASVFQSSPGPKAGCNARPVVGSATPCSGFNPHPARRPGATLSHSSGRLRNLNQFQSSPGPEGRVQLDDFDRIVGYGFGVSILTRPEGRVQHGASVRSSSVTWFQSSPGPKAGCNHEQANSPLVAHHVSILTRPEGRVQPVAEAESAGDLAGVSILTRPEGRVQLRSRPLHLRRCEKVSILTRPEGRVQQGRLVDDTNDVVKVSILTRPEGRVQHFISCRPSHDA